ncbi:MAG: hypothetical protein IH845_05310 [Nanoarchaeota archaeon]|nr:hypothetical protein [Nanoarchaeota archaeon]
MDWKAGIIKAKDLPEGETVYLKNSYKGWGVVHPIKNEDGTWNWFNFWTGGSWWNVLVTVVIILLLLGVVMEFSNIISYYTECFEGVLQLETCKDQFRPLP